MAYEAYFNSRPSARGDRKRARNALDRLISIHAPPRGATEARDKACNQGDISIHAPPRGATQSPWQAGFPPISIHAPPRGATRRHTPHKPWHSRHFNSRPSARGDFVAFRQRLPCKFQFTPLREGRRDAVALPDLRRISIHAPPRGATPAPRQGKRPAPYFNSRPSARGDLLGDARAGASAHFNSRPSARGDLMIFRAPSTK